MLSPEQAARLMELNNQYRAQLGYDVSDRDNWFGAHLSNYLTLLCLSPRAAPSPRRVAEATKKKRVSFRAFARYFQRPAVAEAEPLFLRRLGRPPRRRRGAGAETEER